MTTFFRHWFAATAMILALASTGMRAQNIAFFSVQVSANSNGTWTLNVIVDGNPGVVTIHNSLGTQIYSVINSSGFPLTQPIVNSYLWSPGSGAYLLATGPGGTSQLPIPAATTTGACGGSDTNVMEWNTDGSGQIVTDIWLDLAECGAVDWGVQGNGGQFARFSGGPPNTPGLLVASPFTNFTQLQGTGILPDLAQSLIVPAVYDSQGEIVIPVPPLPFRIYGEFVFATGNGLASSPAARLF